MSEKAFFFALLVILSVSTAVLFKLQTSKDQESFVSDFLKFKSKFQKQYLNDEEESYRKVVFYENLAKIEAHNSDETQTYTMGITQFADLTEEEFVEIYLSARPEQIQQLETFQKTFQQTIQNNNIRDIDWVAQGMTGPIRNQGQCGSCWAFSATGCVESAFRIHNQQKNMPQLSVQQLVDCSKPQGNYGCNGGWVPFAFKYMVSKGIVTQEEYPYTSRDGSCKIDKGPFKIRTFVGTIGCMSLEESLKRQPISAVVDASNWSLYQGGILSRCGINVNHAVIVVGSSDESWKIQNTWGMAWGEDGYIRLTKGNTCGVCRYPFFPII